MNAGMIYTRVESKRPEGEAGENPPSRVQSYTRSVLVDGQCEEQEEVAKKQRLPVPADRYGRVEGRVDGRHSHQEAGRGLSPQAQACAPGQDHGRRYRRGV